MYYQGGSPHTWAVGSTFEYEFSFAVLTNPAYRPKPATKSNKPLNQPTKRAATKPARRPKQAPAPKPKRITLTPDQRKARTRARAVATRQQRKLQGICKDHDREALPRGNILNRSQSEIYICWAGTISAGVAGQFCSTILKDGSAAALDFFPTVG